MFYILGKYANLLFFYQELDEKIETTLMFVW